MRRLASCRLCSIKVTSEPNRRNACDSSRPTYRRRARSNAWASDQAPAPRRDRERRGLPGWFSYRRRGARSPGARSDESRNAIDQFRAAGFGMILAYLAQLPDHRAFAALDSRYVDAQRVSLEPELDAAPGQGDYLGRPDQVLAWQAGDVGTGDAEQPALDDCHATRAVAGPCGKFAGNSAA